MPRLGVLGWPVAHSRSPAMHNAALQALGMEGWRYQLLPVPPERFAETVAALAPAGFVGANVTIPHKHSALALADSAGEAARAIGAANTLTFGADGAIALRTPTPPACWTRSAASPRGLSAQVLGAGGSARAVVWALREAGAREVSVWNRTPERASALARDLGARAVGRPAPADVLVNCTSVGLEPEGAELHSRPLSPRGSTSWSLRSIKSVTTRHVVDLVYRCTPTPLLAAAQAHGARTVDGLEILLAQGALSFELWTGARPPLQVMRRALRD